MSQFTVITFGTAEFSWALSIQKRLALRHGASRHVAYTIDSAPVQQARAENAKMATIPRGYGLWIWKPYILLDALSHCEAGHYVIYLDAGVTPIADMTPWFAQLMHRPVNLFAPVPPRPAWVWTKRACFSQMLADTPAIHATPMLSAGIQAYRNTPESLAFIAELQRWMRSLSLMTDAPDPQGKSEVEGFVVHRHDQSILTLLAGLRGVPTLREPSQYGFWSLAERAAHRSSTVAHPELLDERCPQVLDVHRGRDRRNSMVQQLWRIRRKVVGARHGVACV